MLNETINLTDCGSGALLKYIVKEVSRHMQKELAEKIGISEVSISKITNGYRLNTGNTAIKIAQTLEEWGVDKELIDSWTIRFLEEANTKNEKGNHTVIRNKHKAKRIPLEDFTNFYLLINLNIIEEIIGEKIQKAYMEVQLNSKQKRDLIFETVDGNIVLTEILRGYICNKSIMEHLNKIEEDLKLTDNKFAKIVFISNCITYEISEKISEMILNKNVKIYVCGLNEEMLTRTKDIITFNNLPKISEFLGESFKVIDSKEELHSKNITEEYKFSLELDTIIKDVEMYNMLEFLKENIPYKNFFNRRKEIKNNMSFCAGIAEIQFVIWKDKKHRSWVLRITSNSKNSHEHMDALLINARRLLDNNGITSISNNAKIEVVCREKQLDIILETFRCFIEAVHYTVQKKRQ